ncbi:MAG: PQQ-binding-like beta-propeller repeat protein, partial [Gemmatimonadota bacterium]
MRSNSFGAGIGTIGIFLSGLVSGLGAPAPLAAQADDYRARLSPLPVSFTEVSQLTGVGGASADLDGSTLTVEGSFRGLSSPAARAEIRRGIPGVPGPVVGTVDVESATAGTVSGSLELSDEEVETLRGESLYLQIATEEHPDGVIRGWFFGGEFAEQQPANPDALVEPGRIEDYTPITGELLRNPPASEWLMFRGNPHAHSYSPLDQVDRDNVGNLRLAWAWHMKAGNSEPAPLAYDGYIFLINPGNVVQALDARTGDLIWEHDATDPDDTQDMRNIALYGDMVIQATTDARLLALDVHTGEPVWESEVAPDSLGFANSSGPIVTDDGIVVLGLAGCARYIEERCHVSAWDAETGERVWRFNTIARSGEPGGDTWGELDDIFRAGGETWIAGSWDPELDLTYWGTAQAKPWSPVSRHTSIHEENLYTNATVALDIGTGELDWHFTHVPGEALDLDEVFERVLVDGPNGERWVLSIGKHGILWKNDRVTGEFLDYTETVYQNAFTEIDPETGAITYRDEIIDAALEEWTAVCPSSAGGKDWHSMSYHRPTGVLVAPLSQTCLENYPLA